MRLAKLQDIMIGRVLRLIYLIFVLCVPRMSSTALTSRVALALILP